MTGANLLKGMVAGFVATLVLSGLMMMKTKMGLMPELDVIGMLSSMMGVSTPAAGWIAHFVIGTIVWGRTVCSPGSEPSGWKPLGHVWTAPLRQVLIWRGEDCGRVRSCVWPVGAAILHDCWP